MWVVVKGVLIMTPKEKNQLLELRRNGWSIKRLAELVHKSIPMIKKILYSVRPDEIYCIECGKPTKRRNVTSKFCSKECKRKYYKKHPDYLKKKTMHTGICPCCGKEFTYYGRSHQTYCSRSCTKKHYFVKLKQK